MELRKTSVTYNPWSLVNFSSEGGMFPPRELLEISLQELNYLR